MQLVTNQIFLSVSTAATLFCKSLWQNVCINPSSHSAIYFLFIATSSGKKKKITFSLFQTLWESVLWYWTFFFFLSYLSKICSEGLKSCDCWQKAMRANSSALYLALLCCRITQLQLVEGGQTALHIVTFHSCASVWGKKAEYANNLHVHRAPFCFGSSFSFIECLLSLIIRKVQILFNHKSTNVCFQQ